MRSEPASVGFPPIAGEGSRVLVLGSLPGKRSLETGQYYAHPRNAFWPIMADLVAAEGSYEARCARLREARIAVWDVLSQSVRPGSLDSAIRMHTAVANDLAQFARSTPSLRLIACNGQKAGQLLQRFFPPPSLSDVGRAVLPSTSPAYASMTLQEKTARWREVLAPALARD